MNTLYYGDNLEILKNNIEDESVDLIYLDPPFQSGRDYNIIFRPEEKGYKGATSQITTFADTWYWSEKANDEYLELITGKLTKEKPSQKLIDLMKAMYSYLGGCSMLAYLCMMAPRLLEMKRVLKSTGSIYLHCDPTASHYLKLIMDSIYGPQSFRNEIVWCYYGASSPGQRQFPRKHDIIFWYSKGKDWIFNADDIRIPYADSTQKRIETTPTSIFHGIRTERTAHEKGKIIEDYWIIPPLVSTSKERLGYPTQKPEALLTKIVLASSHINSVVLDPFCGCGTAIAVAEKLNRKWIGIDISYLSIDVITKRFKKSHIYPDKDFEIHGVPKDPLSAVKLAEKEPFKFELWAVSQLNATPTVKSGDKGVDGVINFIDHRKKDRVGKGIISVKGGQIVSPTMVRELKGTIQSQNADFGILITNKKPTKGMMEEAIKDGYFEYVAQEGLPKVKIPRIQLITVEDLFEKPIKVTLPHYLIEPYKKPEIKKKQVSQGEIEF